MFNALNYAILKTQLQQIASVGGQELVDAAVAARDAAQGYKDAAAASAAQLAAGLTSPGVYATFAALVAAKPTGDTKIYVVTADGNWYYWNGSVWAAGGVYQATAIADGSVQRNAFDEELKYDLGEVVSLGRISLPVSGGALPTVTRFNIDSACTVDGLIKKIIVSINTTGDAKIKILSPNGDGTYRLKNEVTITFTETGDQTLVDGIDFNNLAIAIGDFVAWYGITAKITYSSLDNTGRSNNNDVSGENISFTTDGAIINYIYEVLTPGSMKSRIGENEEGVASLQTNANILFAGSSTEFVSPGEVVRDSLTKPDGAESEFAIYDNSGDAVSPGFFAIEPLNGKWGTMLTGGETNLFGSNTSFENGTTGWTLSVSTAGGSIESSTEQSFAGSKSLKIYGGTDVDKHSIVYKQINTPVGEYMLGFALYSPEWRPTVATEYFPYAGSVFPTVGLQIVATDKPGWWWVTVPFLGDGRELRFGLRVQPNCTLYADSFVLVKTDGVPMRYFEYTKQADKFNTTVASVGKYFTAGMVVKANQIYTHSRSDVAYLGVISNADGDNYSIEYRKAVSKFAVRKTIGAVETEVLSDAVTFNQNAVIGIAIQQTPATLKLYIAVPHGIVIDFDDGDGTVYNNAFPLMKEYGLKGSSHIITGNVGTGNDMTLAQLLELKRNGWDIDSHTVNHADLSALDEAGQLAEIAGAQTYLKTYGFAYDLFVSPFGAVNNTTYKLLRDLGIRAHRGYSSYGYNANDYPFLDRYRIKSDPTGQAESSADAIIRIDSRMSNYKLQFLTFHGIAAPGEEETVYNYHYDKFSALMQHIVESNYPTYSYSEIIDAYDRMKVIGNVHEFEETDATIIDDLTEVYVGSDSNYGNHFDGVYTDFFITRDLIGKREFARIWGCKW